MTVITECTHDLKMPKPSQCYRCMEDGPVAAPEQWAKVGSPFTATYAGTCIGCDAATIEAGQQIQRWDRGSDRTAYLHARCTP